MSFPIHRGLLALDEVRSDAHALTEASIGKPIGWKANGKPEVWNDTAAPATSYPIAILHGIINANRLKVSSNGFVCHVPDTLLPSSMPVDGAATNSRFLYWDFSLTKHVHSPPNDSSIITETLYWIGPGDIAANSVCFCMLPNRPSIDEIYLSGGGGSFREAANKAARLAITPLAVGDRVMQLNIGLVYSWNGTAWLPEGYFGSCDTLPDISEAHVGTILYNRADDSVYKRAGSWILTLP